MIKQYEHARVKNHFFFKLSYTTEIARCICMLVGLVRSLKSSHKEALKTLFCED